MSSLPRFPDCPQIRLSAAAEPARSRIWGQSGNLGKELIELPPAPVWVMWAPWFARKRPERRSYIDFRHKSLILAHFWSVSGRERRFGYFRAARPIGGGGVGGTAPVETNHVLPGYRGRLEGLVEIDGTMGSSRYGQTAPF